MPFYEYQCAACGHHHEELQKVTDRPLRKCPDCGRPSLKRLVSAPVFRLKGGGWYETDFKSEREDKRNLAGEKEPAAADGPPAEKPKDEKAEAKPPGKRPEAVAKPEAAAKPAAAAKPEGVAKAAAARKPKAALPVRARRRR